MNDCAFEKGNICTALREKTCKGCTFMKTKEELIEGRKRAMDRIHNLPNPKRYYIIHTYHKQWRGGLEK